MGLITPGKLSLFFSSACIICLMIDNKIFKGEAWSIALFLVFLVPFYNCMFEILFFLLGILSWMFNIIWVFIFAVICDLICWMLLTNLLFIVVLIVLCMCISEFCVPISQLLSVSEMTYDNWDSVFICISWTNAKIIASVNYIHIEWKKYSYFATQREATCNKELFAGENNYRIWYFSLNHKFNQQNHQGDSWEWHPRPRECRNKVGSPSASVLLEGRVHANVVLFG